MRWCGGDYDSDLISPGIRGLRAWESGTFRLIERGIADSALDRSPKFGGKLVRSAKELDTHKYGNSEDDTGNSRRFISTCQVGRGRARYSAPAVGDRGGAGEAENYFPRQTLDEAYGEGHAPWAAKESRSKSGSKRRSEKSIANYGDDFLMVIVGMVIFPKIASPATTFSAIP
jgi:hypothetical protein